MTYHALVKKNPDDFHADNSGINWYRVNDPVMGTVAVECEDRGSELYALPKKQGNQKRRNRPLA